MTDLVRKPSCLKWQLPLFLSLLIGLHSFAPSFASETERHEDLKSIWLNFFQDIHVEIDTYDAFQQYMLMPDVMTVFLAEPTFLFELIDRNPELAADIVFDPWIVYNLPQGHVNNALELLSKKAPLETYRMILASDSLLAQFSDSQFDHQLGKMAERALRQVIKQAQDYEPSKITSPSKNFIQLLSLLEEIHVAAFTTQLLFMNRAEVVVDVAQKDPHVETLLEQGTPWYRQIGIRPYIRNTDLPSDIVHLFSASLKSKMLDIPEWDAPILRLREVYACSEE